MNYNYFDIHSHIYFPDFDADREDEILKLQEHNIATITVGVDFETSEKAVRLAETHDNIFASVGMHPDDVIVGSIFDEKITTLAEHSKVVCIGECGLDYFRLGEDSEEIKKKQKEIFKAQIELALNVSKPLMLHIRPKEKVHFDAYTESLDILEQYAKTQGEKLRGNVHFFVGDLTILKRFLNIGFSVSFGGVITFTHEYDECVAYAPLSCILSETDAPFVAPDPYRGKRNSPLHIPEVVSAIARIRGEDIEVVRSVLVANALQYCNLNDKGLF